MRVVRFSAVALAGLALASPVAAQEWQGAINRARHQTAALVAWPSGYALVARCEAGDFQVFMRLPEIAPADPGNVLNFEGQSRTMGLTPPYGSDEGQVLFTQEPSRAARWLLGGGQLSVTVGQRAPVTLALPEDQAPLREAMRACDRPETDSRDLLPTSSSVSWRILPRPGWPRRAATDIGIAVVGLSCILAEGGRLHDCVIERESPAAQGFGREAVEAMSDARVQTDGADALQVGTLARFNVIFQVQ